MTLKKLKELYKSVFYIEDDYILDVILAVTISTKLDCDPIWLLIIGGSSSGKSELINALNKVSFVYPVSSMSENSFLSAMRTSDGSEPSLLHRIGNAGMITMKDYTSILSMRSEKRELIVSQMREIYDGKLDKETGNGNSKHWEGKINWIGAVTDSVYIKEGESAGMGRRTINYIMPIQDRIKTTMRASENNTDISEKRLKIQEAFKNFVDECVHTLEKKLQNIDKETKDELVYLADFVTLARTPTERNFKNELVLVPDPEMPMRVFQMFLTLAKVFAVFNGGKLEQEHRKILYRLAIDSIPKQRIITLKILAAHEFVTTKGAATKSCYPTATMGIWLEDVNVLGLCKRIDAGMGYPDKWILDQKYKDLMIKYANIKPETAPLGDYTSESDGMDIDPMWSYNNGEVMDEGILKEQERKAQQSFGIFD